MNTAEQIFKALQENLSHPPDMTLQEALASPCDFRTRLRMRGEKPNAPEAGSRILLREYSKRLRWMVKDYLAGCFEDFKPLPSMSHRGLVIEPIGTIDGVLVEVIPVSSEAFVGGRAPDFALLSAAWMAARRGADIANIILFDRNRSHWSSWMLKGNFVGAHDFVEMAIDSLETDPSEIIVEGEDTCASCPFSEACAVADRGKIFTDPAELWQLNLQPYGVMTEKLDQWLTKRIAIPSKSHIGSIHPSMISTSSCDRKIAYALMNVEAPGFEDTVLRRIFDAGHCMHDVLQTALLWSDPNIKVEAPLAIESLRVCGHCDGVEGKRGHELKSIGHNGFLKLNDAKKEHQVQGTFYMAALALIEMVYTYADKDTGDLKSFLLTWNERAWKKHAARAEAIVKTVETGNLPPRIDKDYECKECQYLKKCKPAMSVGRASRSFNRRMR